MNQPLKLSMLVVMSLLIVSSLQQLSPPLANGSCTNPSFVVVDAAATSETAVQEWQRLCLDPTELVLDCPLYNKNTGQCFCATTAYNFPIPTTTISGRTFNRACIPNTQIVANSNCRRLSANNYACQCLSSDEYKFLVNLDPTQRTNNPEGWTRACSKFRVPNCLDYQMIQAHDSPSVDLFESVSGNEGYQIVCENCIGEIDEVDSFIYEQGLVGVGCPRMTTFDESCQDFQFNENKDGYECLCQPRDEGVSYTKVTFSTNSTQLVRQGCLANNADNLVQDCKTYTYSSDSEDWRCNACQEEDQKIYNVKGDGDNEEWVVCLPKSYHEKDGSLSGCKQTAFVSVDGNKPSCDDDIRCTQCESDFDQIKIGEQTIQGAASPSSVYHCATKGRWNNQPTVCSQYDTPDYTETSLVCSTGQCASGASDESPCGTCNTNAVNGTSVNVQQAMGPAQSVCIDNGIVDFCSLYNLGTDNSNREGCNTCLSNYELVDTQISLDIQNGGATPAPEKKICIRSSFKDSNCEYYSHRNLTCLKCSNNLVYDETLKRCRIPADSSINCFRAARAGNTSVCISCNIGFTLVSGSCYPSVEKCANLTVSGCAACVSGYQLINNKCLRLPDNCLRVDASGACISCRPGFQPNSQGQCASSTTNTCPSGQVPRNGVCVPVQIPIPNCIRYTVDSRCQQCSQGFRPANDGLSCIVEQPVSTLKPCPPNTSRVIYRRNPSNPTGDCVAVDVNCEISRDDGFCIACKNNEYAHTDGKCYRIVFQNGGF